jgi:PIN domain nuclease of toxin-antitoxin system
LLDAHAFLWWIEDPKIGAGAYTINMDPENDLALRLASICEIAIKPVWTSSSYPSHLNSTFLISFS